MSIPKSLVRTLTLLLLKHDLKRVTFLFNKLNCNQLSVANLSTELQTVGIYSHIACVDMSSGINLDLWYNIQRAVSLSMNTFVSCLTPYDVITLVEVAESLTLFTPTYNWIFFDLLTEQVEELESRFPGFRYNNIKGTQVLTNRSLESFARFGEGSTVFEDM